MVRKLALSLATLLALSGVSVLFTTSAVAYDRTQGGVIPGSRDNQRFVYGRGWVPNQHRRANVGHQRGHNRAATTTTARSFQKVTSHYVGSYRVLIGQTIQQCVRSRITGEVRC